VPGAVLPSTLAALSGLGEDAESTLVVNAGESSVTTAIVEGGVLLLHRMVDFAAEGVEIKPDLDVVAAADVAALVDRESTSAEWTMQQPVNGYGVIDDEHVSAAELEARRLREEIELEFQESLHREAMLPARVDPVAARAASTAREVTQAVSVATAYFEDTFQRVPGAVLSTGSLSASELSVMMVEAGFSTQEVRVRAMVEDAMLTGGATTSRAPMGWLAGVRGALRS